MASRQALELTPLQAGAGGTCLLPQFLAAADPHPWVTVNVFATTFTPWCRALYSSARVERADQPAVFVPPDGVLS
jgi:hypothetical protein